MDAAGCSRREALLRVGSLGALGLTLPALLAADTRAAADRSGRPRASSFGRARSCIVVWLKGGPSQLDTFDPKPGAPSELRGPFQTIGTSVPGIDFTEHVPHLARQADKLTVLRTVSHGDGTHSTAGYLLTTGRVYPRPGESVSSREDAPHYGAVAAACQGAAEAAAPYVMVPDYLVVNGELRGGQNAGLLGTRFDPLVPGSSERRGAVRLADMGLGEQVPRGRLTQRHQLLARLEGATSQLAAADARALDSYRDKAFALLESDATRRVLSGDGEADREAERYGRGQFGQSVLMARRLVEAGVRLVHVNCMSSVLELTRNWDTHKDNFNTLKDVLLPRTDRAVAALIEDLADRGLLAETLVVVMGEFGRTPKVNADGGRDHWPPAASVLLAGAGVRAGATYGATDRDGAYPIEKPVSPARLAATIFHALGIDPELELITGSGRPYKICDGAPVLDLWG